MIYFQLLSEEESAHTCTKHSHTHTYTYTTTHIQTCTHTYKHTHTYLRTCTLIQTQMSKESCSIPTSNKQCPISCGHITQLLTTYLPSIYSHFSLSLSLSTWRTIGPTTDAVYLLNVTLHSIHAKVRAHSSMPLHVPL